jgi:hypothetical protein
MSGRGGSQADQQLQRAIERLSRAADDMRRASSDEGSGQHMQSAAESRRAADRLQEAKDMLGGLRQQESGSQMDDLVRRTDRLSQQQHEFEEKLKRAFPNGPDGSNPRIPGQSQPQAEALASEKDRIGAEVGRLERDLQNTVRALGNGQRKAATKLRETLGDLQQSEIQLRNKYNSDYIRKGFGGYILPRETPVTMGIDRLRDGVKQAQNEMAPGSGDKQANAGTERALDQLERLRKEMEGLSQGGQKGNQQGQRAGNQQGGQQPGQQQGGQQQGGQQQGGQQQGGQQGGQQPGGQRAGNQQGQGQPGQQSGDGQIGGQQQGDASGNYTQGGGWRNGDRMPRPGSNPVAPADAERIYRDSMRQLSMLRQEIQKNPDLNKELGGDLQQLMRDMQNINPTQMAGNPAVIDDIRTQILPALQSLELQLRRKLEGSQAGQVRSGAAERIPQGYGDAVAEYFRRLSKGK